MPEMLEPVTYSGLTINVTDGSFTRNPAERGENWRSCREYFARDFIESTKSFFMAHSNKSQQPCIANFIWKVEDILALNENTTFAPTQYPNILCVKPAEFWKTCEMRRSLLTAMLRAGRVYDDSNKFENVLFESRHLKGTNRALMRFMFGFTRYDGPKLDTNPGSDHLIDRGWYWAFHNADDKKVRDYLKWPVDSSPFNSSVQGTLWAA